MSDKNQNGGRPSTYSAELAEEICARLVEGQSLTQITADEDMPATRTVYYWLEQHEEFLHMYRRARDLQADTMADMVVSIPMTATPGADVQLLKLQMDAMKWRAAKLKPRVYGADMLQKTRVNREEAELIDITPRQDEGSDVPQLDRKQLARVMWHMVNSKRQEEEATARASGHR